MSNEAPTIPELTLWDVSPTEDGRAMLVLLDDPDGRCWAWCYTFGREPGSQDAALRPHLVG